MITSVREYLEFDKTVCDFTINGKCSKCGQCCSAILPVTPQEVERIRKYIEKNNIKPVSTLKILATKTIDLTCPFYEKSKCLVYEVRPRICKDFMCNKTPQEAMSRELIGNYKYIKPVDFRKIFGG